MRFVWAIVLFVVAVVAMGLGIAQRTILAGPAMVTESAVMTSEAPITIIDGATLNAHDGTQSIEISGAGDLFMAFGRTTDVMAWVGDASYNTLSSPEDPSSALFTVGQVAGSETTVPNPAGSDLWIQEFTSTGDLTRKINAPEGISVIIASDGTKAAPPKVAVTWPVDNSTPWSGPLLLGGVAAALAGIIVFLWALVHARRVRGPRRKPPRMPRNPKPPRLKPSSQRRALEPVAAAQGAVPGTAPGTAPAGRGRRRLLEAAPTPTRRRAVGATAALAAGAIVLAGCAPTNASGSSPSPSASAISEASDLQAPAVTAPQLTRILSRIADTVAAADEAKDPEAAETRLAGPALDLRKANYAVRTVDAAQAASSPIPAGAVKVMLPQQNDLWPRTVLAVVQEDNNPTAAPTALLLVQDSPRENYKVLYTISLDHSIPEVAPKELGAALLPVDNKFLLVKPEDLAKQYGDVLANGADSEYAELFEAEGDNLQSALGVEYKKKRKSQTPPSAVLEYTDEQGPGLTIPFVTNDSGAIVAVDVRETETVKPVEAGAAINTEGAVKALSGKSQSTRGITSTYALQILFYVPPVADTGKKVIVLGFTQGLVSARELG